MSFDDHPFTSLVLPAIFLLVLALCIAGCFESSVVPAAAPDLPTTQPVAGRQLVHKPYGEKLCDKCHDKSSALANESKIQQSCVECHAQVLTAKAVMHGPVSSVACTKCHVAHTSSTPPLLATAQQSLCTQCHPRESLSLHATAHRNSRRSCLDCHMAHGGSDKFLLRPDFVRPGASTQASLTAQ